MLRRTMEVQNDPNEYSSNAGIEDIKDSPCKKRPDINEPCFLLDKPKNNFYCLNCGLIPGKGKVIISNEELERKYNAGEIKITSIYNFK